MAHHRNIRDVANTTLANDAHLFKEVSGVGDQEAVVLPMIDDDFTARACHIQCECQRDCDAPTCRVSRWLR